MKQLIDSEETTKEAGWKEIGLRGDRVDAQGKNPGGSPGRVMLLTDHGAIVSANLVYKSISATMLKRGQLVDRLTLLGPSGGLSV